MNDIIPALTARIAAAYVGNPAADLSNIPEMIGKIGAALSNLQCDVVERDADPTAGQSSVFLPDRSTSRVSKPAVPVAKSVFPAHLICLECGENCKIIKRHLMTAHHLEPREYRERWGLPATYPMVAPDYAAFRSGLAKASGLGKRAAPANGADARGGVLK